MIAIETISPDLAEELCRKITADLPEYFGLTEVNEHYAIGIRSCMNLAAKVLGEYVGLISIDFPYPKNANIYWIGILRKYHRQGIGRILSNYVFHQAKIKDAKTVSVKTLSPQEADENYLKTYNFYRSLGFSPLFNLKPIGYEWNMVYMLKTLDWLSIDETKDISIHPCNKEDIDVIIKAFNSVGWNKPARTFEEYLKEVTLDERLWWLAFVRNQFAGYITLKWQSYYLPFKEQNIPEIMDLNVLPHFRKMGIGSMLLDTAEKAAATKLDTVGLGVGLYTGEDGGYGAAQRLYVKRGYLPNGKGITYNYQPTVPGSNYPLDDELILWLTKTLK